METAVKLNLITFTPEECTYMFDNKNTFDCRSHGVVSINEMPDAKWEKRKKNNNSNVKYRY